MGTYYIIANNRKFDISKVAERLNEGDTVMWLNGHLGWKKLRSHPIYSKCSHEIFFNFKVIGIGSYRRNSDDFSKVYWASGKRSNTVPTLRAIKGRHPRKIISQLLAWVPLGQGARPALVLREPQIVKEALAALSAASAQVVVNLYFKKESSAVTRVLYTSRSKRRWSAGHKALRYLLKSVEPHHIKLAGFTFRGKPGHPWAAEKKFARRREIEIIN